MKYETKFGFSNYLGVWMNRLFWLFIVVTAALNFSQNPEGLTILITLILIVLIGIKTDQYIVHDTAIEVKRNYFFDLVPIVTLIPKHSLRDVQVQGNRTMGSNILLNLLPVSMKFMNRITFVFKDGRSKSFRTEVYIDQLEEIKANWRK